MNEKNHNLNNADALEPDANRDPITGTPGAHPVGTGLGAAGVGAVAGAAGGVIAGPVGVIAGAAIGAVVGGLAGKATAEAVNPTVESKFWRDNHSSRPYANPDFGYDEYAPAYQYGWESYGRHADKGARFEHVEGELRTGWDKARGTSRLGWDKAKDASREAWDRMQNAGERLLK